MGKVSISNYGFKAEFDEDTVKRNMDNYATMFSSRTTTEREMSGYCDDCGNTVCICDEEMKLTYPLRHRILSLELELASTKKMLDEAINSFRKISKIRRKDGNDNEYEGAEALIAKDFLAKHEKKEWVNG